MTRLNMVNYFVSQAQTKRTKNKTTDKESHVRLSIENEIVYMKVSNIHLRKIVSKKEINNFHAISVDRCLPNEIGEKSVKIPK